MYKESPDVPDMLAKQIEDILTKDLDRAKGVVNSVSKRDLKLTRNMVSLRGEMYSAFDGRNRKPKAITEAVSPEDRVEMLTSEYVYCAVSAMDMAQTIHRSVCESAKETLAPANVEGWVQNFAESAKAYIKTNDKRSVDDFIKSCQLPIIKQETPDNLTINGKAYPLYAKKDLAKHCTSLINNKALDAMSLPDDKLKGIALMSIYDHFYTSNLLDREMTVLAPESFSLSETTKSLDSFKRAVPPA